MITSHSKSLLVITISFRSEPNRKENALLLCIKHRLRAIFQQKYAQTHCHTI
jgi:hypothetical protein